jgi:hypothetical protein
MGSIATIILHGHILYHYDTPSYFSAEYVHFFTIRRMDVASTIHEDVGENYASFMQPLFTD